jgi:hypothetical protein
MVYNRAMAYIRTNIYITSKQKEGLIKAAEEKDIKFSEAVRDAISKWLKEAKKDA